jgi:TetR/AcrR family transcriptional regulator, mexJK operon transcriptional repressor
MAPVRKPGRPQDQDKREAILAAGRQLMTLHAFDFSMDDVARLAGVARQTVYNVYPSKEGVVSAVIAEALDRLTKHISTSGEAHDIIQVLTSLSQAYLNVLGTPERVAMIRVMMSPQSIAKNYGSIFYGLGPLLLHERLSDYLAAVDTGGRYHFPNPSLAADMFISAVVGSRQLRALLGVEEPEALGPISERVALAVKMFLKGHETGR